MPDVIIIGAGLTGLSAAYHLEKQGIDDIVLLEHNQQPGGLLRTVRSKGFTFDYTGHFIHVNNTEFLSFLNEICNLQRDFDHITRSSGVLTHQRINPYPFQMNLYGLPPAVIAECITGFVERKKHIKQPKTFLAWVEKHFGSGISKHFFEPFQQKILSYDLEKIEPSWTGRFVPKTDLKTMVHNALTPPEQRPVGYNSSFYYPSQGGIDSIITALTGAIKTPIQTQHSVTHIDTKRKVVSCSNGATFTYKHLITTMPLNTLMSSLAKTSDSTLPEQANKLICNSVMNVNLGIAKEDVGNHHWLYVPDPHIPFYRLGFWSNIHKGMAPQGTNSLYAEFSFMPGQDTSELVQQKIETTKTFLKKMYDFEEQDIITEQNLTLHNAYVIHDAWRKKHLSRILSQLENEQIISTGRFGGWNYSSMQEAVLYGKQASHDVAARLLAPLANSQPIAQQRTT